MAKEEKKFVVEFAEEELSMVHDIFDELTGRSLEKWTKLLPPKGEYRSTECFEQWKVTELFEDVRRKAAKALGIDPYGVEDV